MEKCNFCERIIEPEKTEILETWGVVKEFRCPECFMFLERKIESRGEKRRWWSVKEIIKEKTKI